MGQQRLTIVIFEKFYMCSFDIPQNQIKVLIIYLQLSTFNILVFRQIIQIFHFQHKQNNMNSMSVKSNQITDIFINSLFDNALFQRKLTEKIKISDQSKTEPTYFMNHEHKSCQMIEEITCSIFNTILEANEKMCSQLKGEIIQIYKEIEKLKQVSYTTLSKIDDLPKSFDEDPILQDDQLFDLPSMKRTINYLQEKVKEISLNTSVNLDSTQNSKQSKYKEDFISDKISLQINKINKSVSCQLEHFQNLLNKRLQKQQKTINNILQTLNDIHGSDRKQKTITTLTSCKSASKLKNLFGFA